MVPLYSLKTLIFDYPILSYTFSSQTNKTFLVTRRNTRKPSHFALQNHLLCTPISTSSQISPANQQHSNFTVNYLINSCGLSPEGAISASKWVHLQSPERPDAVLGFLRNHGFSETQISKLVRSRPQLLLSNPEKTLLPKLEFFVSLGVSQDDVAKTLAFNPKLLSRSLKKQIIPTYNFLNSLVSDEKLVAVFKHNSCIFVENNGNVVENVALLRESGMPKSCISMLLAHYATVLMINPVMFRKLVDEVKELGFNLEKSTSVNAMRALCGKNKMIWNRSRHVLRTWGWSEDHVLSAFRKNPQFMVVSEKKLMRVMDLLVNRMGWPSGMIAKYPVVLSLSLERRLVPRCSVVKVLLSKGLVDENLNLGAALLLAEKQFVERFVAGYLKEVPKLLDVYQGKVDIQDALVDTLKPVTLL